CEAALHRMRTGRQIRRAAVDEPTSAAAHDERGRTGVVDKVAGPLSGGNHIARLGFQTPAAHEGEVACGAQRNIARARTHNAGYRDAAVGVEELPVSP